MIERKSLQEQPCRCMADYYRTVERVWQLAIDAGAKVLALNIIEAAASNSGLVQRRNLLNDMIMHHEEEH